MKKISIIFGAISALLFMLHGIIASLYYIDLIPYGYIHKSVGGMLSITVSVHMIIALVYMGINRQKDPKAKLYPQLNIKMMLQSASGIFAIIFLLIHVAMIELSGFVDAKIFDVIYGICEIIFVSFVTLHISISIPKLFVSIGLIKKQEKYALVEKVTAVVVLTLWLALVISMIIFFFI